MMPRYRVVELIEATHVLTITAASEHEAIHLIGEDIREESLTPGDALEHVSVELVEPEAKP